jgi:hypothetical protein
MPSANELMLREIEREMREREQRQIIREELEKFRDECSSLVTLVNCR